MKKIITLTLCVFAFVTINAQVTINDPVDFTVTTLDGTEFNLFNTLDGGQYVLLEFFYVD